MTESSIMIGTITVQAIAGCVVFGLVWLTTGRDPLYWIARWSIQLRAAILQGAASARAFIQHYQTNYPETLWQEREAIKR